MYFPQYLNNDAERKILINELSRNCTNCLKILLVAKKSVMQWNCEHSYPWTTKGMKIVILYVRINNSLSKALGVSQWPILCRYRTVPTPLKWFSIPDHSIYSRCEMRTRFDLYPPWPLCSLGPVVNCAGIEKIPWHNNLFSLLWTFIISKYRLSR